MWVFWAGSFLAGLRQLFYEWEFILQCPLISTKISFVLNFNRITAWNSSVKLPHWMKLAQMSWKGLLVLIFDLVKLDNECGSDAIKKTCHWMGQFSNQVTADTLKFFEDLVSKWCKTENTQNFNQCNWTPTERTILQKIINRLLVPKKNQVIVSLIRVNYRIRTSLSLFQTLGGVELRRRRSFLLHLIFFS